MRTRSRALVVASMALVILFAAVSATAAWLATGTGTGSANSSTLEQPTNVAATALSSSSIQISFDPPTTGPAPDGYIVRRTAPTAATVCDQAAGPCTDSGLSASTAYSYTVESKLGSWRSGQTTAVQATTPAAATPNFLVELVTAGDKTAGTAFDVRLTARTGAATDISYTGPKAIVFSGPANSPSGQSSAYPSSVTFTSGVGTASITLYKAETVTITATEGGRTGGVSATVVAGTASRLVFSSESSSCATGTAGGLGNGGSYTAKVTRLDTWGNVAAGSEITVNLGLNPNPKGSVSPTSVTIALDQSESSASFTATLVADTGNQQVTVTAASGSLTSATCTVKEN